MSAPLRLGFAGTPAFAATILERLLGAGFPVHLVLTQPDRPTGRGRKLQPSPVKVLAQSHNIPLRQPSSLRRESLVDDRLDVLIVAAYGLLLPAHILTAPRLGCVNVHASLLPRWRGAAPVERAIMAGDETTGVCIMRMDEGLDTGPVYARVELPIAADISGGELETELAKLGAELLIDVLPRLETLMPQPQSEVGANYARKLSPADSRVDWQRSAWEIERQIRAMRDRAPVTLFGVRSDTIRPAEPAGPTPGARPDRNAVLRIRLLAAAVLDTAPLETTAQRGAPAETSTSAPVEPGTLTATDGQHIDVRCGSGLLRITRVQLDRGKGRPLDARSALNGFGEYFTPGARLLAADPTADTGHGGR
ncbi:MAG: methionyl-tRNA formyltransferase [Pseudomonadales bacterium]|nr:methionyl-tRNA formyltransferase [Pseudomonadales bacterium]